MSLLQYLWVRSCVAVAAMATHFGVTSPARVEARDNRAPVVPTDI